MAKRLRFVWLLVIAIFRKYYWAIIAGLALGVVSFIVIPKILPLLPRVRHTQTVAVIGRYTQAEIPNFIQQKISVGLTTLLPDGEATPALALKWETKDENKSYVFTLDRSKKWQDGTAIKSRDITYNFKDTVVEYPDDSTILIKLTNAFSPLPVVVSRPVFKRGLLGAGQYKVTQVKKNGQIIESLTLVPVTKNLDLPKIKYLFYASDEQARTAFELGVVRSLDEVTEVGDMVNWPNTLVTPTVRNDRYVGVFFNTQDNNFQGADGKNLRLALSYAVDKKRWPNRALGPINPDSWAYNSDIKPYDQDLKHAKDILSKVKAPKSLNISTTPAYLDVAEAVKTDWEKLGIKVEVVATPEVPSNFQVLVIAQAIPIDPDQYNLWHQTQTETNLTGLSNPRISKLLEDGRKVQSLEERKKIYMDFQKYLVEEVPVIFLFHPVTYTISRS